MSEIENVNEPVIAEEVKPAEEVEPAAEVQAIREVSVSRDELRRVQIEMAQYKGMLKHLKELVIDLKGTVGELHEAINDNHPFCSNDSGNVSAEKRRKAAALALAAEAECVVTEIAVGDETLTPEPADKTLVPIEEDRPIQQLLYGIIRRNPNKVRKNNDDKENSNMAQNKHDIADGSSAKDKKAETSKRAALKPVNAVEVRAEDYLHKKKKAAIKSGQEQLNAKVIPIGSGITTVPRDVYAKINWSSYTIATRKLLMAVFSRKTLATHSLTGKASPAFANKPAKLCLDPKKVADIIMTVAEKCKVRDSFVRNAITTKCADENKMMRMRLKKNKTASF